MGGPQGLEAKFGLAIAVLAIIAAVWGPFPSSAEGTGGNWNWPFYLKGSGSANRGGGACACRGLPRVSRLLVVASGMDLAAKMGEPVYAVAAGKVEYVAGIDLAMEIT